MILNHVSSHSSETQILACRSGEVLPLYAESLWKLDSGFVRTLTWNEEGDVITLGVWGAGDVVGQPLSHIQPYQIECLTSVRARLLPAQFQVLDEAMKLHLRCMQELIGINGYKRASIRLWKFLHWLASRFGCEVDQGLIIDLRLTHQILAELTGITRVTATRLLSELEQEGKLIRLRKRRILLTDSCRKINSKPGADLASLTAIAID